MKREVRNRDDLRCRRHGDFPLIYGCIFGQLFCWYLNLDGALIQHPHKAVIRHYADLRVRKIPLFKNLLYALFLTTTHDDQHSLLGLTKQILVWGHAGFGFLDKGQIDLKAFASAALYFANRASKNTYTPV